MNTLRPAGLVSRLIAWILDLILIAVFGVAFGSHVVDLIPGFSSIDTNAQAAGVLLFIFWAMLLLFQLVELVSGQSPAKWLLGLKVRRPDGGRVALGRRLVRCLGNVVPLVFASGLWALSSGLPVWTIAVLAAILLLGLVPLFGPMRQPLPDLLAGTVLYRK